MSWAAHNPEQYDEIVLRGVVKWMDGLMSKHGFEPTGEWLDGLQAFAECVRESVEARDIWLTLLHNASAEIINAESDYWSRETERAMHVYKDR